MISLLTCLCLLPVTAESGVYTLGNKSGWNGLSKEYHITQADGKEGCAAWAIAERELEVTATTDILLDFDSGRLVDDAGNYNVAAVSGDHMLIVEQSHSHGKAALFRGEGGLVLKGTNRALFGKQGLAGSFTIGFWLNPAVVDSGEQIFAWRSSRNLANYSLYQMINADFESNHMTWLFTNVFDTYSDENHTVQLEGKSVLVPEEWSFHQLVYDADSGLLEYSVNGRLEDMCYVTDTGRESGTMYPARLGVVADVTLCSRYAGYLDDFCILREAVNTAERQADLFDRYYADGGIFVTRQFEVSENGIKINSITVTANLPEQTDTSYYIRWSNQPYGWTETEPEWHQFTSGQNIASLQSGYNSYFQIKGCLFTDGTGSYSPVVSGFDINYENRERPFAPYNIRAVSGNGSVTLSWKDSPTGASSSEKIGGYLVYYGERPGEYLGTCALEGVSPVDCGNLSTVTITGLQNGKMYYFAVCAYSGEKPVVYGPLSSEVYARPGSVKN